MPPTTINKQALSAQLDELIAGVGAAATDPVEDEQDEQEGKVVEPAENNEPEETPETEPDSTGSTTDAELADYRSRLNEMAKLALASSQNAPAQPAPTPVPEPAPVQDTFSFTQEEYDAAISSPEGMQKLIAKAQSAARVAMLKEIPAVVEKSVREQVDLRLSVQEFYSANKDLVPFKSVVALKVRELEMAHPEWGYGDIFKVLGKEVRTYLRLPNGGVAQKSVKKDPAFPPTTGTTRKSTKVDTRTPLQKELDELDTLR